MSEFLSNATFFGVFISLLGYEIGLLLKRKWKKDFVNPMLISIIFVIIILVVFQIDYNSYNESAKYLSYFLTPATVCLAIPLYEQMALLKKNGLAVILGILSGVVTSLTAVFFMSLLFHFTKKEYVTMLPKSITTAIGMGVAEELHGYVTITVAAITITGIFGNIIAKGVCKLFRITNPVAKGVAIGTASHAMGTAKAIEMGEVEGAMSSLAIAVAGLLTVVLASVYANFM